MASRSLNKVLLIGNLTRDPELRYTPSGTAVCTFGLATNRQWTTDDGGKKEEAEFHTIVAWQRLAEIVTEYLKKGSQAYVEGRLSTREWEAQDGTKRRTTEIIANEIIFLGGGSSRGEDFDIPSSLDSKGSGPSPAQSAEASITTETPATEESEDIPF
ncbi:MAG: single-stranded DNA-binding protein [Candidatus Blackburnbacteria bacterium]|nr:single-stranded DNA-binding protein [Candidatus Blackburnbacteria bacterium]